MKTASSVRLLHVVYVIVNPKLNWLACSPDELVVADGAFKPIKIKCLFGKKDTSICLGCTDNQFYMRIVGRNPKLKAIVDIITSVKRLWR